MAIIADTSGILAPLDRPVKFLPCWIEMSNITVLLFKPLATHRFGFLPPSYQKLII
jgi:hypothetical protein